MPPHSPSALESTYLRMAMKGCAESFSTALLYAAKYPWIVCLIASASGLWSSGTGVAVGGTVVDVGFTVAVGFGVFVGSTVGLGGSTAGGGDASCLTALAVSSSSPIAAPTINKIVSSEPATVMVVLIQVCQRANLHIR